MVHVENIQKFIEQPIAITGQWPQVAELHFNDHGDQFIDIGAILDHNKRRNIYYFLALARNAPTHGADWKPMKAFADDDETITKALHSYIVKIQISETPSLISFIFSFLLLSCLYFRSYSCFHSHNFLPSFSSAQIRHPACRFSFVCHNHILHRRSHSTS